MIDIPQLATPKSYRSGLDYVYEFADVQVRAILSKVHEGPFGTVGELEIRYTDDETRNYIYSGDIKITSFDSRTDVALRIACSDMTPSPLTINGKQYIPTAKPSKKDNPLYSLWRFIIEYICVRTTAEYRKGEEFQSLGWSNGDREILPDEYIIHPIIPVGMPTILFGDGGKGKSTIALRLALLAMTPDIADLRLQVGSAQFPLYLDWESGFNKTNLRFKRLLKGLDLDDETQGAFHMDYLRCYRSLSDELPRILKRIADHKISFVIIDSLALACGGDLNESASAMRFFEALRYIEVATLIIAHQSKTEIGKKTVFGSVFFTNLARSVWEHISEAEPRTDEMIQNGERAFDVTLFHRKANEQALCDPLGFRVAHYGDTGPIIVERSQKVAMEMAQEERRKSPDATDRVIEALRRGPRSREELMQLTEFGKSAVYAAVKELRDMGKAIEKNGRIALTSDRDDYANRG